MAKREDNFDMIAVVNGVDNLQFRFTGAGASSFSYPSNFTTSKVKVEPPSENLVTTEYQYWGENNDLPDLVLKETAKNAYASSLLDDKVIPSHYARGVYPVKIDPQLGYVPYWTEEVKLFWKICDVQRLQKQIVSDYEWMRNMFLEFVMDKTGRKIGYVKRQSPFKSRWGRMTEKGQIKELYISSEFPKQPSEEQVNTIACLDYDLPYYDFLNRSIKPGQSLTRQFNLRTRNKDYYEEAGWHALILSWLPIANAVPEIKKKIIENQMTLKYQIEVPMEYFRSKATMTGVKNLTAELFKKYFTEFLDMINTFLSGKENSGKTLVTPTDFVIRGPKSEDWHIKIIPIKDEMKDSQHLSDNYQANVEIAQGLGIDISLTGRTRGGSEDGSGSSKFQAHTINLELQHFRREQTLSWLYFVKQVNNWPDDMEFRYMDFESVYNTAKQYSLPANQKTE